jgi:flagellar motor switch protein FliN/FliY
MARDLRTILSLEVPVVVQLATREMSLGEVSAWSMGAILELPKSADEPLELLVNNRLIGRGAAVKVGENFGIALSEVGDLRDRAAAITTRFDLGAGKGEQSGTEELSDEELAERLLAGQV